jgi:hypothetical protein
MSNAGEKPLTVKVTVQEMENLKHYCELEGRTQTDVIRAYLRSLRRKLPASASSKRIG